MFFYGELPNAVEAHGNSFFIKTDFRYWLEFDKAIREEKVSYLTIANILELTEDARLIDDELVEAIMGFYQYEPKYPMVSSGTGTRVMDYEADAPYIYADFMRVYGIDLNVAKIHWWTFLALLRGLMNRYSDIVGYRCYEGKDKEMLRARERWKLQQKTTTDKDVVNILLHGGDFTKGD